MNEYLTVGKAAESMNVNPRTLRFYDKIGLLCPSYRSQSGYRLYSPQDIERFHFISRAKELGLTLEEIRSVLSLTEEGLCLSVKHRVGELLDRKIGEVEIRIKELQLLKEEFTNFRSVLGKKESRPLKSSSYSCLE